MAATALQLCPFSAALEAGLRERFAVVRWFELDEAGKAAWLAGKRISIPNISFQRLAIGARHGYSALLSSATRSGSG